uniref:Uncharacterized protein n=1 Tax=Cacopsylla melanoneura TaxID=428564 RepID=A0A8D8M3K6_9HEMI
MSKAKGQSLKSEMSEMPTLPTTVRQMTSDLSDTFLLELDIIHSSYHFYEAYACNGPSFDKFHPSLISKKIIKTLETPYSLSENISYLLPPPIISSKAFFFPFTLHQFLFQFSLTLILKAICVLFLCVLF